MRRKFLTSWAVLLVLVVVLAVAAGCGGDSSSDGSKSAANTETSKSADQIVKDSETAMAAVKSGAFTADAGLEIQGDASKMTDETAKAMLSQGVTLHAEGKSASQPTAVDMTMAVSFGGQNLEFGMMADGTKAWIEYQDVWYALDKKNAKTLDKQASSGAAPTEQLKSLGLDPAQWDTKYELVETVDLNGVQVNHVRATADPQKVIDALMKAAEDPAVQKKLGGSSSELGQLKQSVEENKAQVEELKKGLKDTTVDYWIGVDDSLMYKVEFAGTLDTTGQKDMDGVTGMTLEATVTMSAFNEPVTVTPPASAKSFDELTTQMFGGMTGTGL